MENVIDFDDFWHWFYFMSSLLMKPLNNENIWICSWAPLPLMSLLGTSRYAFVGKYEHVVCLIHFPKNLFVNFPTKMMSLKFARIIFYQVISSTIFSSLKWEDLTKTFVCNYHVIINKNKWRVTLLMHKQNWLFTWKLYA